ncbi:MAG TPA: S1C family serine protease [Methylomirabilota bacterium]|nr:S1C family serine protease [Methylomirabilota bacterium]
MDASVEIVKHLLTSVVHIHAEVPSSHPSTRILGDERMGTGTVVDPAGLVLTVNYVVMGAETIQVTLGRGRALRAEIVAQDFEVGLALLRVKRQGLTAAPIADSESLARGAPVFALGSTGPRERRVAGGLVTYLGEFEEYWEYLLDRGIVSSAANPGFGGGPLFTLAGQMVGVVMLNLNDIARCSLAIPTECYRRNQEEFMRFGRVVSRPQRAWLGVFAHVLEEGVVVAGLVPNGPGARSGIQEGDLIVSLDAQEVPTRKELYISLWKHAPGEKMTLEVMRDNEVRRLSVTGGDRADFYKQSS